MGVDTKISVFMPAYNAAQHIESVIERIPDEMWSQILDIWIINDGSTDTTKEIIDTLEHGNTAVKAVHLAENKGYGTAVQIGIRKCRESSCDFAVCLHADGQYPPESIPEFVQFMKAEKHDIVQGSRIASGTAITGGMPVYKYIAGKILTFFENYIFGLHMSDYHSGFLMYSRFALDTIPFHCLSRSFDFDVEVIACARSRGLSIAELPIPTRYADEISYLNPVYYGMGVLCVMAKYRLGMYRGEK